MKNSLIAQLISLITYTSRAIIAPLIGYPSSFNILFNLLIILINLATFIILLYSKVKLGFSEDLKIFEKSKIKKIMKVSEKIDLEIMRNILEMNQKTFQEKIIDYSQQYGMKVEGTNLIINKERLDDFLNSLEQQFKEWEENDKNNFKKI